MSSISDAAETALGRRPTRVSALHGGCVGEVYHLEFPEGPPLVGKIAPGGLAVEGRMLTYLREKTALPVPEVHWSDDRLLLLALVEQGGSLTAEGEQLAAEQLAELHNITADAFGFPWDTVIGGLPQPNSWQSDWRVFFIEQRLLPLGRLARDRNRLAGQTYGRLETFCHKLPGYIDRPGAPALVHGDIWSGNVLCRNGKVAAYIDPAIYFADAEVELAFIQLFSTFGSAFFDRYHELRPINPGFREARCEIYNLFPLLVHTALFGAPYDRMVERTLMRYA